MSFLDVLKKSGPMVLDQKMRYNGASTHVFNNGWYKLSQRIGESFEFRVKRKNQECMVTFYVGCHCYHQSNRRAFLQT